MLMPPITGNIGFIFVELAGNTGVRGVSVAFVMESLNSFTNAAEKQKALRQAHEAV